MRVSRKFVGKMVLKLIALPVIVHFRSDLPSCETCPECFFLCYRSTDPVYPWLLYPTVFFNPYRLQLGLLVGIGLAVYAVLFLFVLFREIGEHLRENLHDFIFS